MVKVAKQEYRLENLSCANCAMKFENNIKKLPDVEDATVNFGASKVSVIGNATIEDIEKAGAFDGIKVTTVKQRNRKNSFFQTERKYTHGYFICISSYRDYCIVYL